MGKKENDGLKEYHWHFMLGSISLFVMAGIANKWAVALLGLFLMTGLGYAIQGYSNKKV